MVRSLASLVLAFALGYALGQFQEHKPKASLPPSVEVASPRTTPPRDIKPEKRKPASAPKRLNVESSPQPKAADPVDGDGLIREIYDQAFNLTESFVAARGTVTEETCTEFQKVTTGSNGRLIEIHSPSGVTELFRRDDKTETGFSYSPSGQLISVNMFSYDHSGSFSRKSATLFPNGRAQQVQIYDGPIVTVHMFNEDGTLKRTHTQKMSDD